MHAIVIHEGGGPEVLRYEEVPDPEPSDGHVLVKVEAAAVNHYDLGVRANPGGSLPLIPGVDAAGTRVDTGERVLVTGQMGAYAELIAAPADLVRPIPDSPTQRVVRWVVGLGSIALVVATVAGVLDLP